MDHFKEFMICLSRHNDPEEGRVYRERDIFKGPDFIDDTELFVQAYGDYIVSRVEAAFQDAYQFFAFVRALSESANSQEMSMLYFTTNIVINDQAFEVVLAKQEFIDGRFARSKSDFNKRTRKLIVSIVARVVYLGNDPSDRQIAVPLPVS
jgi:hypothetical protein